MSSTPRFFVPPAAIADGTITLPSDAAHHATRVLRLRVGEMLTIHDGLDNVYHATLATADGKAVTATVESVERSLAESTLRITVAQALPKTPDKIEQVLQHGTEIGAAAFAFWAAQRSVARLSDGEKIDKRLARWRGVVQGAAEQSGRGILPTVDWWDGGADVLATRHLPDFDATFILHESATISLRSALADRLPASATRLLLVVGPEGGLTDAEVARFVGAGAVVVSLGPRVLRTETAALAGVAQVLFACS